MFHLVADVKILHFQGAGALFFMMTLAIPAAVAFLQLMGVGGCGWPSSVNASLIVRHSFTFMKSAPNAASAVHDAKTFKMV